MPSLFTLADLTIIVPGKNAQATLETTLQSLKPLMRAGASCALVNDGSSDATGDIMNRFAAEFDKVQVLHFDVSQGVGVARNAALKGVTTALMGTVDSDDWIGPDYYRTLIAHMNRDPEVDFVRSHFLECRGNNRTIVRAPFEVVNKAFDPKLAIMPDNKPTMVDHPQIWAGLYRMDFLNKHGIRYDDLQTAEDRIFNWKTQVLGRKAVIAEEFRFFYRRDHTLSLTAIGDARQLCFLDAMSNVIEFLIESGHEQFLPKAFRQLLALISFHISRRSRLDADTDQQLILRSSRLLKILPTLDLERALSRLDPKRSDMVRGLL